MKAFTLSIIVFTFLALTYLWLTKEQNQVLASNTGCCEIQYHKVSGRDIYYIKYIDFMFDDLYVDTSSVEDFDQVINEYQEFCYHNH